MFLLDTPIRHYAWGSADALPRLLGRQPDGTPWAEAWIGAHPAAPSALVAPGAAPTTLDAAVRADPLALLGPAVTDRYGARLPYLLKLIAPASPLSIQVHPDAARARSGHDRGTYLDPFHKPEMVLALTSFDLLCGFRPLHEVADVVEALAVPALTAVASPALEAADSPGPADPARDATALRVVVAALLHLPGPAARDLATAVTARASALAATATATARPPAAAAEAARTIVETAAAFPGDIGVVVAALLRRSRLEPGEAAYVPAGTVHAYLGGGLGVEIMAASDNVVRAGLTPKTVDVEELLAITDVTPGRGYRPVSFVRRGGTFAYEPGAEEFALDVIDLDSDPEATIAAGGPRLALPLDASAVVTAGGTTIRCPRGGAVFVGDASGPATASGSGRLAVARVPLG